MANADWSTDCWDSLLGTHEANLVGKERKKKKKLIILFTYPMVAEIHVKIKNKIK